MTLEPTRALAAEIDIHVSTGALSVSPLLIDTQPVAPRRQVCAVGRPA